MIEIESGEKKDDKSVIIKLLIILPLLAFWAVFTLIKYLFEGLAHGSQKLLTWEHIAKHR